MNISAIIFENRLLENRMILNNSWYAIDYFSIVKTMIRYHPTENNFIFPASLLNIEFKIFIPHEKGWEDFINIEFIFEEGILYVF